MWFRQCQVFGKTTQGQVVCFRGMNKKDIRAKS